MVCVAVTRGGTGELWRFASRTDAYLHPLVQYGDPRVSGPGDICSEWNQLTWSDLLRMVGIEVQEDAVRAMPVRQARLHMQEHAPRVWDRMLSLSREPPADAALICEMVSRDRRMGTVMPKKTPAPAEGETATEKTSNLPPAVKGPKGVPPDTIIQMGVDKEGRQYGPDHNPKKPGSKTHGRFALYRDGMTIKEALDAGIETADLVYDLGKGFIKLPHFRGGSEALAEAA